MQKRSLTIHGHRTSISLEEPFWVALNDIAKARKQSLASLVRMIDEGRDGGLSSAIRVFICMCAARSLEHVYEASERFFTSLFRP